MWHGVVCRRLVGESDIRKNRAADDNVVDTESSTLLGWCGNVDAIVVYQTSESINSIANDQVKTLK